ncbi:hypothetical protein MMC17_004352 [Xylographa soralifera]|nr:hypothetical protein [Xylographa soralifera]
MEVQLYVYDLSKGIARQMSRNFLGTHIDAVYHTSLVFGSIEYFFGAGVQTCYPGSSHHGRPMEVIPMGMTQLDIEVILEYLESLKTIYTAESYDLFLHNCNNFSNDFAMFLVGRGIPDHITSLPQTVLNTPFGQMLKPQLDQAMRGMTQAPLPRSSIPPPVSAKASSSTNRSISNASAYMNGNGVKQKGFSTGIVHNVTGLKELDALLQSAKSSCAVIFFTSATCPPCKICYPAYEELALEAGSKAVLIKVDLSHAFEIGSKYKVRATPTFMTFLHGERTDEWSGANPAKLLGNVRMLVQMAHPPHPHSNLQLPTLQRPHRPVTYAKLPPLDKLIAKLGPAGKDPSVLALKEFIATRSSSPAASAALPSLPTISAFITSSLTTLPPPSLFPLIDILRLALVDVRVSGYFASDDPTLIRHILQHSASLADACPHALRIVTLQLACNLFTSTLFPPLLLSNPDFSSPLIQLATSSLLDEDHAAVRVSAASLAFNIAAFNHAERLAGRQQDTLPEHAQVELLAGMLEALGKEEASKEMVRGLALALGLVAYGCGEEVKDVLETLGAKEVVKGKKGLLEGEEGLAREVGEVVG